MGHHRWRIVLGVVAAGVLQTQSAYAVDPAIRYIVSPAASGSIERASLNDFGQAAFNGGQLWTPSRRNGLFGADTTKTSLSQFTTVSEVTNDGTVLGTYRPSGTPGPDDGYLRIWKPDQPNGSTGSIEATSTLGQALVATAESGDLIWGVRTMASPYDIQLERWHENSSGGFDRTALGVSVPLRSYVSGMGQAGDRLFVSVNSDIFTSATARDSLSVLGLSTGERTVLRAGTSAQDSGYGAAISADGVVVGGTKRNTAADSLPLAWFPEESGFREQALSLASPAAKGQAFAINDHGQIVGWTSEQGQQAALWEDGGTTLIRLQDRLETHSSVGCTLGSALAINELGQILSRSTYDHDADPMTPALSWSVLLTPARLGDADVDQDVDFDDLLTLAQNYGTSSGQTWFDGDFTGNGVVDFDDLLALAQQYGFGATETAIDPNLFSHSFAADFALARSLVPEPATLVFLAGLAGCTRRSR